MLCHLVSLFLLDVWMALLTESEVRRAARSRTYHFSNSIQNALRKSVYDQNQKDSFDVFLSHSYTDMELVLGIAEVLRSFGIGAYIDWIQDRRLDRSKVTAETARVLRSRMVQCNSLIFVATSNSKVSKWMPWELGYFDALRERVAVFPIEAGPGVRSYTGQEYLGLYPYISKEKSTDENDTLWVNESTEIYVNLKSWLRGKKPSLHRG